MRSLEARVLKLEGVGGVDRKRLAGMSFTDVLQRVILLHTQWFVNGSLLPGERMELAALYRHPEHGQFYEERGWCLEKAETAIASARDSEEATTHIRQFVKERAEDRPYRELAERLARMESSG